MIGDTARMQAQHPKILKIYGKSQICPQEKSNLILGFNHVKPNVHLLSAWNQTEVISLTNY